MELFSNQIEKKVATRLFDRAEDFRCKGVALGLIADHGLKDFKSVLPVFEAASASENWDVREMAQMFFRRLIKPHRAAVKTQLLRLVRSDDSNIRRFVAETLRPVRENQWFYGEPEYPLSIVRHLFSERSAYPRTAVGNNLSDLSRRLPDLVFNLVRELVESGDKNSRWIAARACRNLVKKHPEKVMDLLMTDHYRYKDREYHRRSSS
jgi:3-methyladenine DNA glycosylase AlkC